MRNGILPIDTYKHDVDQIVPNELQYDWEDLRTKVLTYGVRNSTLSAQMPSESSSVVSNATNGIEPPRGYLSIKKSKKDHSNKLFLNMQLLKTITHSSGIWSLITVTSILLLLCRSSLIKQSAETGVIIQNNIPTMKFPVSVMAQDLLTTYKLGWKTSYYQNTYDIKTDEVEDTKESLDNLIAQLENAEEEECESCKI